jgi:hypothetical protein
MDDLVAHELLQRYLELHPQERDRPDGYSVQGDRLAVQPACVLRFLAWVRTGDLVPGITAEAWDHMINSVRMMAMAQAHDILR